MDVNALSHELPHICWRPPHLGKGEAALYTLEELARDLVAHDMALLAVVELLTSASFVDTHHGDSDGPRCLSDTKAQVAVVGVDVPPLLERFDDLDDRL